MVFLMKPAATSHSLRSRPVISIAYPAADVLLLALVARLLADAGAHTAALRLLAYVLFGAAALCP